MEIQVQTLAITEVSIKGVYLEVIKGLIIQAMEVEWNCLGREKREEIRNNYKSQEMEVGGFLVTGPSSVSTITTTFLALKVFE